MWFYLLFIRGSLFASHWAHWWNHHTSHKSTITRSEKGYEGKVQQQWEQAVGNLIHAEGHRECHLNLVLKHESELTDKVRSGLKEQIQIPCTRRGHAQRPGTSDTCPAPTCWSSSQFVKTVSAVAFILLTKSIYLNLDLPVIAIQSKKAKEKEKKRQSYVYLRCQKVNHNLTYFQVGRRL
jgi:hypothetical protein